MHNLRSRLASQRQLPLHQHPLLRKFRLPSRQRLNNPWLKRPPRSLRHKNRPLQQRLNNKHQLSVRYRLDNNHLLSNHLLSRRLLNASRKHPLRSPLLLNRLRRKLPHSLG